MPKTKTMSNTSLVRGACFFTLLSTLAACGGNSSSDPSSTPAIGTPTSAASTYTSSKETLLNYLAGLSHKSGPHLLIGQHTNYWHNNPTDDITGLLAQTGQSPAVVGLQVNGVGAVEFAGTPGRYNGVTLANQYLSQGHVVMITEVPGSPQGGSSMWGPSQNYPPSPIPAANFANITTPGTAEYDAFQAYLQTLASTLQQIDGAFLFRPFAEQNGDWFWYGAQYPSQFIAMWQMEWNYLTNAGLTNIIWVYATNSGIGNYTRYYPGSTYVDIVGEDAYPPSTDDFAVWSAFSSLGKPMIYAEAGTNPDQSQVAADSYNSDSYISLIESNFPQVIGVVQWCQSDAFDNQVGASTVMADPQAITLSYLSSTL
jgi:mannan endo-1,4-beta-mannosidase